jgi:hypothetical protein
MMIRKIALAAVLVAACTMAMAQDMYEASRRQGATQHPGTAEEQAACRPDVRRLCRSVQAGGDYLGCLKQNREKLSRACRGVLEKHGQ